MGRIHETYYVVGHFHYIVMGMIAFAGFGAIYYWFPLVTGKMYQKTLAKWHFWLSEIGVSITFFAFLLLGYLGMPRRYATYEFSGAIAPLTQITTLHQVATVGAFIILFGQIIWVWNMAQSYIEGPVVQDGDPWDLKETGQHSREFQWFEEELTADEDSLALTDGGESDDEIRADGGEVEAAVRRVDDE